MGDPSEILIITYHTHTMSNNEYYGTSQIGQVQQGVYPNNPQQTNFQPPISGYPPQNTGAFQANAYGGQEVLGQGGFPQQNGQPYDYS